MLGLREPREGGGRVDWRAAEDAGMWGCGGGGDEEGSGSSSSGSDSLEAEPVSSKKLRVLLSPGVSSLSSFTELEKLQRQLV